MTTQAKKVVTIKPLEGYTAMSDPDVVYRAAAAQTGLTGDSNFQNLPVDPTHGRAKWPRNYKRIGDVGSFCEVTLNCAAFKPRSRNARDASCLAISGWLFFELRCASRTC